MTPQLGVSDPKCRCQENCINSGVPLTLTFLLTTKPLPTSEVAPSTAADPSLPFATDRFGEGRNGFQT
jgi:hypothetical protein